ncbi:DUF4235 domain-containing protein [Propioniciclava tarda]|uniref:DUF4235 domain-containing protein n=1 Tax=Propioniciclava tarda TaxID=433330 RepID=A0A4Q9KN45_PROTD|nr:DUF4235 domain-containing protein [Propioniciclava tarda]TBT96007.1 DUF4235 domain-containing protein [Propioniciclava tarda]SMO42868.1 Protein of unknown function [Propioniciclava tarda]HOA88564.1 DUF4235 domain-containing protein [Propioniciclava tarda]HQA30837.1 DUF4235 domain-containing protein [Propioniciclava tarda]HQD60577.1 DUF4235 domain-containing protein [Propioniciclava tarda]
MAVTRNLMFNAYSGAIAAATAVVANKIVESVWRSVTGEEPPEPNDPSTPPNKAFAWVLANAIGIGILGVAANRFAAGRWAKFTGEQPPSTRSVNLKL